MKKLLLKLVATDQKNLDIAVLFLRLFVGCLMFMHGWSKIMSYSTLSEVFPDPLGVGSHLSLLMVIFAEAVCSLLLIFGLMTRLAMLPLMFNMLVITFVVHGADPFQTKEFPLLYLGMYIVLLWTGGCRYSLDELIRRKLILRAVE